MRPPSLCILRDGDERAPRDGLAGLRSGVGGVGGTERPRVVRILPSVAGGVVRGLSRSPDPRHGGSRTAELAAPDSTTAADKPAGRPAAHHHHQERHSEPKQPAAAQQRGRGADVREFFLRLLRRLTKVSPIFKNVCPQAVSLTRPKTHS